MPPTTVATVKSNHRWNFFRAGGVDQVSLLDANDLRGLRELDQKLWVALAMPTKGIDIDPETLALVDFDHDGRIRVPDLHAAIAWIETVWKKPEEVLISKPAVELGAIKDAKVLAAVKRALTNLKKEASTSISFDDAMAVGATFADTILNGDGIVIPGSSEDADTSKAITDAIAIDSVTDRSGKPGIDQARADAFFAEADKRAAWLAKGREAATLPLGDGTAAAADAIRAVRAKIDDYFTRARIAEYDPRGQVAMGGEEKELLALATRTLSETDEELAKLPLSAIDKAGRLSLSRGLNPAWAARMKAFTASAVTPVLGARDSITSADLGTIADKLTAYEAWLAEKPTTKVDGLDAAWVEKLAAAGLREKVRAAIAEDARHAPEYEEITSIAKLVRFQRDFGRLLRNFVNFSDFYSKQDAVFQAGTLYLDARAMHLCVYVDDVAKHSALATSSDAFLAYCEIKRGSDTKQIVAAMTNGDADNLFVGRHGVFYDRAGKDWDAVITKLVSNPISIREAFWSPYKKLVKVIEDNVTRRVSAADQASTAKLDAVGKTVANVETNPAATAAPPAPAAAPAAPPPAGKKIDLGMVAAIGIAIGGVGTLIGTLMGTMFGLGPWLPIGILAIILMISAPSMALAWLKLRRRNVGPILDGNGWAINSRARINVAFGAAMTEVASLPAGAKRSLDDPFADKKTPWKRWTFLVVLLVLALLWFVGRLDRYLPNAAKSISVLGKSAPAYVEPKVETKVETTTPSGAAATTTTTTPPAAAETPK